MINLARGSVAVTVVALLVVSFYFQRKVEAVSVVAIDSQNEIQKLQKEIQKLQNQQTQDQKTQDQQTQEKSNNSSKTENKEVITVTIDSPTDSKTENNIVSKAGSFSATAYCLQGRTATGGSVRRGIVAADPRVLPLGTRINLNAGTYSGSYVVADTGGGVKGKKLDIWVPSCTEARRFGRRSVGVNVMGKRK